MLSLIRNNGSFRWIYFSQIFSLFGNQVRTWAIIYWVFFALAGQSPVAQSMIFVAEFGPAIFLGAFCGCVG